MKKVYKKKKIVSQLPLLNIFPEKIKKLREGKGLTQEQLAEMVELHVTNISKIERGLYIPPILTLERIAKALDVNAPYLLQKEKDNKTQEAIDELTAIVENLNQEEIKFITETLKNFVKMFRNK